MEKSPAGRRVRAAEKITAELMRRISSGVYAPHEYLPPERTLASEFGASPSTVSAALEEMAQRGLVVQTRGRGTRVLPALERLSRKAIGIVNYCATPQASTGREPALTLTGIQDSFLRVGYRFELVSAAEGALPPVNLGERYGGLIFVESSGHEEQILELERQKVPLVVANLEVELDVSATWVDHRKAALRAVSTLVGLGHKRIAFLGRKPDHLFYGKAREGYLAGLQEAGVATDESRIAVCEETDPLSAYFAAKPIVERPERPTAIVAARDILAQGACRAITEAGLVVGKDVSVIGFDDVSWPQEKPFLTTFHEPCREMGEVAAQMLAERIVHGYRPPEKRELEAPLILRRSAGPLF
jgi:LacI family transcriptional regulator